MINRYEVAGLFGCLLVVAAGLCAAPALAQQPSPEQISAIRSNCRSDFMSKCSGVTPGGADALACLRRNVAQLSPACQSAVKATTPAPAAAAPPPVRPAPAAAAPAPAPAVAAAPAPAPAPAAVPASPAPVAAATPTAPMAVPSADQVAAIRASCPADFTTHCAGVPPGGLEGLACLQRNAAKLSPPCRFAVGTTGAPAAVAPTPAAAQQRTAMVTPTAPAPKPAAAPKRAAAPAPAPAAAASHPPTAGQQAAIRASCRNDFMSRCAGVQPGGADALACLKRNAAGLSPACKTAVAAIGAPAATAAATPAAAPAAPTAAQQQAIKATCRRDFMMNCRGVQPGGPEAFACLQRNASRLSPDCKTSLAAISDPGVAATSPAATTAAATPAAKPIGGPFPLRRAIRQRLMGN